MTWPPLSSLQGESTPCPHPPSLPLGFQPADHLAISVFFAGSIPATLFPFPRPSRWALTLQMPRLFRSHTVHVSGF
jgi:hypothetical protein